VYFTDRKTECGSRSCRRSNVDENLRAPWTGADVWRAAAIVSRRIKDLCDTKINGKTMFLHYVTLCNSVYGSEFIAECCSSRSHQSGLAASTMLSYVFIFIFVFIFFKALCWLNGAKSFLRKNMTVPYFFEGRLCGLVFRVPAYRSRDPGFDSRRYQIF
jgi:hypothetical protein